MKVLPQQLRLYAVTDRTWLNGRRLADVVAQAIDGGATFVQLREKCLDEHDLLAEAEELSALCHFRHVPFVIDDNVEVALAAGADGVHVGQSDMAAKRARALLGPDKILGVSAHNAAEALAAQADGADYLGCGAAAAAAGQGAGRCGRCQRHFCPGRPLRCQPGTVPPGRAVIIL